MDLFVKHRMKGSVRMALWSFCPTGFGQCVQCSTAASDTRLEVYTEHDYRSLTNKIAWFRQEKDCVGKTSAIPTLRHDTSHPNRLFCNKIQHQYHIHYAKDKPPGRSIFLPEKMTDVMSMLHGLIDRSNWLLLSSGAISLIMTPFDARGCFRCTFIL